MDTYVGLDGHVSSCPLGVLGPGGNDGGRTSWRRTRRRFSNDH